MKKAVLEKTLAVRPAHAQHTFTLGNLHHSHMLTLAPTGRFSSPI
jgi:hypothetical protein